MIKNRLRALAALTLAAGLLLGACSSDSKKAATSSKSADKGAFCLVNQSINDAAKDVTTPAEFLAVIKTFAPQLDDWAAVAPAEIKADAATLVAAAKKAIASNDGSGFQDTAVTAAGTKVDSFCGTSSSSSSSSSG